MENKFSSSSLFGKNRPNENKMNICTPEDLKSIMARKESLPKCPSWNSFAIPDFQSRSGTATPDGTPQSSPKSSRKLFTGSSVSTTYESSSKKQTEQQQQQSKIGWLNTSGLFSSFNRPDEKQNKSRSYRNISNFDINAVSPISF